MNTFLEDSCVKNGHNSLKEEPCRDQQGEDG
mgnify:CR=1 FL=1